MGLDLSALSHQVRAMSGSLATEASDTHQRTTLALGRYLEESAEYALWAQAADLSRETSAWLLARPVEPLNATHDLPPRPNILMQRNRSLRPGLVALDLPVIENRQWR